MTQQDKAKAYDEALKRAKEMYDAYRLSLDTSNFKPTDFEYIFPELAESEDERIRQEIIECIETLLKAPGASPRLCDWLAWLEKQKEQKPEWTYPYGKNETVDKLIAIAECLEVDGDCSFNGYTGTECGKFLRELARKETEKPAFETDGSIKSNDYERGFCHGREFQAEVFAKGQKPVENPINWTELTWEDINELEGIINNVHYEFRNGIGQESFGKEVLERFREYKGDEYLDEIERKPEWSEEDEEKLKAICTYLRDYPRLAKLGDELRFNEYCDFLKSLRPQDQNRKID